MDNNIIFTKSQERAIELFRCGKNMFLTGKAGTGKSLVTKYFIKMAKAEQKNVIVCAPTGIAALNIEGSTIHRVFHAPSSIVPKNTYLLPGPHRDVLDKADLIIIDEISMVRLDLFEYVCRCIEQSQRRTKRMKQLVVVGDFFQLSPVLTEKETSNYEIVFGADIHPFMSPWWNTMNLRIVELTEIVRQKEENFTSALDKIRIGDQSALSVFLPCESRADAQAITLCPTNKAAMRINMEELAKLETRKTFSSRIEHPENITSADKPTDDLLALAVGARIMMLNNDSENRWVNGSLGVVVGFSVNGAFVELDGKPGMFHVTSHKWSITQPKLKVGENGEKTIVNEEIASFEQLPMKLAWAITVHKSQGQTFECVNIESSGFFANGQLYVALSRSKTLDGVHINGHLRPRDLRTDKNVEKFMCGKNKGAPMPIKKIISVIDLSGTDTSLEAVKKKEVGDYIVTKDGKILFSSMESIRQPSP